MTRQQEAHAPGSVTEGFIPLAVPNIGELEREYVLRAVDSGFVSSVGPFVNEFEDRFAEYVGARYAVACSSGTAGIHIALILLGVEAGDDVFVQDFSFIASANPIVYLGARPVFIDSETRTWNMDPALLEEELARRVRVGKSIPKVVEVVHALGQPAEIEAIADICERYGIALLEDAAESLGAGWSAGRFAGRQTGTVGRVGVYSFNGNKIATTGGGGMIVTNDPALARRAKHLTTQAKVPDVGYLHDEVGYNYRLTNLAAGLGLAQLERLPAFIKAKRRIAARYDDALRDTSLEPPPSLAGSASTYWLYSVLVPGGEKERDAVLAHLRENRIDARALWRPLSSQPPFAHHRLIGGPVGAALFARGFSLPCATTLSESQQDRVIEALRDHAHAS